MRNTQGLFCTKPTYETDNLDAIHEATCLRAQHSLQITMSAKWKNYDSLLNSSISRKSLFSEIEHLLSYLNILFAETDESKTIQSNRYVLCGGHFQDKPITLVTTDMSVGIYAYGIVGKERWAYLSACHHHIKPEPSVHLAVIAMLYLFSRTNIFLEQ